ncbi:MAG: nucleotidyltransferase family protein, partial [Bryobacteraceae bacterium]
IAAVAGEHIVLKGFTHYPDFAPRLDHRVQYDLDLYLPAERVRDAQQALIRLGYRPHTALEDFPTDHLPTLVRPSAWRWTGDYFDPEIPISVDLHFRLWDEVTEGFSIPGLEEFWPRRFHLADRLAYASLHLLRHLLRASVRPAHAREIAWFLDARRDDDGFWREWRELHPAGLRQAQAIAFRLAREWFGGRLHAIAEREMDALPDDVRSWFDAFGRPPFGTAKNELWLHLCLLDSARAKGAVIRRRLFPMRLPPPPDPPGAPRGLGYLRHVATRARHHAVALAPTLRDGLRWRFGDGYWRLVGGALLVSFGLFLFFLLYNLRLAELGYRVDAIGRIAGAMTAGSLVGALAAGWFRLNLAGIVGATAILFSLRTVVTGEPLLVASAFASGVGLALWQVSVPPAVAALIPEARRPTAFGVFSALAIGAGVIAG